MGTSFQEETHKSKPQRFGVSDPFFHWAAAMIYSPGVFFFFPEDQLWPFSNLSTWKRLLDRPCLKEIWGGDVEMTIA